MDFQLSSLGPKPLAPKPKNQKPRGLGLTLKSQLSPYLTSKKNSGGQQEEGHGVVNHVQWEHHPHHSWMGQSTKILTKEAEYYILAGTLRATQKCLWSNLRVEFSGDIHPWSGQFSRGLYRPRTELQIVAMDSWQNSDVFKKKKFQNPPIISWVIDGPP